MKLLTAILFCTLAPVALSVICTDPHEELDCSIESRCENTCTNPDAGQLPNCQEDCRLQHCKCAEGYLRHDGKCVAVEDCPK